MADQGMNIEVFFRQAFEIDDSVEIVPLMEAAISVVASKHPQELLKRRKRINKILMFRLNVDSDSEDDEIDDPETTTQKTTCTSSKIDEERPKQQHHEIHDIKIPARRKSDKKIVSTNKVDERKAMELKLDASKRKLQEGYSKNQEERKKRSIKVLDVKDIPAPQMKRMKTLDVKNIPTPQKKNSSPRSRILKKFSRPRTQLMSTSFLGS